MKSKCTLIFKALISMVLVFILLFGTVATSIAAVVETAGTAAKADLAETGWSFNDSWNIYGDFPSSHWSSGPSMDKSNPSIFYIYYPRRSDTSSIYFRFHSSSGENVGPNNSNNCDVTQNHNWIANSTNGAYYMPISGAADDANKDKFHRVLLGYNTNDGYIWGDDAVLADLSATIKIDGYNADKTITVGDSVTLTASATGDFSSSYFNSGDGGKKGVYTYQYSTDNTNWENVVDTPVTVTGSGAGTDSDGVTFTPTKAGKYYVHVFVNDGNVVSGTNASADRYDLSSSLTLYVNAGVNVAANPAAGGSPVISTSAIDANTSTTTATIGPNTKANISARTNAGYTFSSWSASAGINVTNTSSADTTVKLNDTTNITSSTVAVNKRITANYTENLTMLTATGSGGGVGSTVTSSVGSVGVTTGSVVTISADTGYGVSSVAVSGNVLFDYNAVRYDDGDTLDLSSTLPSSIALTVYGNGSSGSGTITVTFAASANTVTIEKYLKTSSAGSYTTTGAAASSTIVIKENGSAVETLTTSELNDSGSIANRANASIEATPVAEDGYVFVGWYDTSGVQITEDDSSEPVYVDNNNVLHISAISANHSYRAYFDRKHTVTVNKQLESASPVLVDTLVGYYDDLEYANVTAIIPNETGYTFDSVSSADNNNKYSSAVLDAHNFTSVTVNLKYNINSYAYTYGALGKTDAGEYAADSDLSSAVTATYGGSAFSSGSNVDYNTTLTLVAGDVAGWEFIGWVNASSAAADAAPTGAMLTATQSITAPATAPASTAYYALYKKIYYLTFYNSYIETAQHDFTFVTAPPMTVTVTSTDSTVRTYNYAAGSMAQRGEDQQYYNTTLDPAVAGIGTTHIVSAAAGSSATYYEGNKIKVLAGDSVAAAYSALASSDAVRAVIFNSSKRYTTEKEPHNLYLNRANFDIEGHGENGDDSWAYDYLPTTTLYANASYFNSTEIVPATADTESPVSIPTRIGQNFYSGSFNQATHTLTWNVTQDYLNIDLQLANKKQMVFSDTKNIVVNSVNTDNYYYYGENLSTGDTAAERLAVYTAGTTNQTNTIVKNDIKLYYYDAANQKFIDSSGNEVSKTNAVEIPSGTITITVSDGEASIANDPSGSAKSSSYIYFTGTMPSYDVYVDLSLDVTYTIYLDSLMKSDVVYSTTKFNQVATITATNASGTLTQAYNSATADTLKGPLTVAAGSTIALNSVFDGDKGSGYMFIGWYKGTTTAPDLSTAGKIKDKAEHTYKPTGNCTIWAVGTKDLFINGSRYITGKNTDWYEENDVQTNIRMEYDPNWDGHGAYYWTITDAMFAAANKSLTVGSHYTGDDTHEYWSSGESGNSLFRIYDSATGDSDLDIWAGISGFAKTNTDVSFGKLLPTSGWTPDTLSYDIVEERNQIYAYKLRQGLGYISFDESTYNGYSSPLTIYFYPNADNSTDAMLYVKSSYVYPNIYVSNGMRGIDTGSDINKDEFNSREYDYETLVQPVVGNSVVRSGEDGYFEINITWGAYACGWAPSVEGRVYHYKVAKKDATVRVSRLLSSANYKVSAFDIYDIYEDKVRSQAATKDGATNNYYADIKMVTGHDLYIVPIIEYNAYKDDEHLDAPEKMTVVVDSSQLDTTEWGDFVACYPWYSSGNANGAYPGQLMVPDDTGESWSASFPATNPSNGSSLIGVLFSNYLDGTKTWVGCSGVVGNLFSRYNYIYSVDKNGNSYTKENCKVQTYDYREPVAFYANKDPNAKELLMNFSVKSGNASLIGWTHNDLIGETNITRYIGADTWPLEFEYLKTASGKEYADLNGNALSGTPTASFYICAKGMVAYDNNVLKRVFWSNNFYQDDTYSYNDGGVKGGFGVANATEYDHYKGKVADEIDMNTAVQWYIYDASGRYITDMLSAGYGDLYDYGSETDEGKSLIAQTLINLGYGVDGKSVAICYDEPRFCYGTTDSSSNTVPEGAGSTFETYRFTGQWLKQSTYEKAKVYAEVGMLTDNGEEMAHASVSAYGSVTVSVDESKLSYFTDGLFGTGTSDGVSYAFTTIADGTKQAITLTAGGTNFVGWYYYSDDELVLATKERSYSPTYSKDVTYYAMYSASATYMYMYTGREGTANSKSFAVPGGDLSASELSTSQISKSRNDFGSVSKMPGSNAVKIYKKAISWNGSVQQSMLDNSTDYVMKITNSTVSNDDFTLTYHYPTDVGGASNRSNSVTSAFNTPINLRSLEVRQYAAANQVFKGWYEADSSGVSNGRLLSTQENFGNVIVKDTHIVAVYDTAYYSGSGWSVYIDDSDWSREMYTDDSGMYYNDAIVRVFNASNNEVTLTSGQKAGILLLDDADSGSSINSLGVPKLQAYAKALNNGQSGRIGSTNITVTNVNTDNVTKFGRADLTVKGDYASHVGHTYAIYAYLYDGETYHFDTTNAKYTGSYPAYSAS